MFTIYNFVLLAAWATLALWLVGWFFTLRGIKRQRPLEAVADDVDGENAPFVSLLVPARNEAGRVLARAVSSMLAQDYKPLEIIIINDRSTDATGDILRRLQTTSDRLRVVDGAELPRGWLGKPHAMQQAYELARGRWLLATDADVIFDSRAVRTAVRYAEAGGYDALTFIPHVECETFWERIFMPSFGWFMLISRPIERVNDPRRPDAVGVGGFFLIHRRWLERVEAWQAVRAEVAEDLRLAETLKAAGARLRVEYAPGLVRTRMQTNLPEIWEGFTKNLYAGARFNPWSAFAGGFAVLLFSVAPAFLFAACLLAATFFSRGDAATWLMLALPCLLVWAMQSATFAVVNRACGVPVRYAALVPLGHFLFVLILFNSTIRILTGRGVTWKGRVLYDKAGVRPPTQTGETVVANE
jgi:chlorobactene glucosyltransferase